MGKRGSVEQTVTNVYSTLESSENLTDAGVPHVILMVHPTEGIIYSGEQNVTRALRDLVVDGGLENDIKQSAMRNGRFLNHVSCRRDKEILLQQLYDCLLPPMPLPFSELRTSSLPLLQGQLARALEVEMAGIRFKPGDPLPEKIAQWFDFGAEAFFCIKGKTHTKPLPGINKCNLCHNMFNTVTFCDVDCNFYSQ